MMKLSSPFKTKGLSKQISFSAFIKLTIIILLILIRPLSCVCQTSLNENDLQQKLAQAVVQKEDKSAFQYSMQLAEINANNKNDEQAVKYYSQSIKFSKTLNDYSGQFAAYKGLGKANLALKNYEASIAAFEESVKAAQGMHNKALEANALFRLATANEAASRYKKTIAPLESTLVLAVELKDEKLQLECYKKLAIDYAKIGKKEKSNVYQNLYDQITGGKQN